MGRLHKLRKSPKLIAITLLAAVCLWANLPYLTAATITWSHTFVDGEVLTASALETLKTDITAVVNAGGGPVTLTSSQTVSGAKVFSGGLTSSGTTTLSGASTLSGAITASGAFAGANPIILEGATADDFETTITVTDPTADNTLTIPNNAVDWRKRVVQVVNTQTGAVASGTTIIPDDDVAAPQNTEGDEYMTLAITPTATANMLLIDVFVMNSQSSLGETVCALFQDSTAAALAVGSRDAVAGRLNFVSFRHKMTADTTIATTFKVRCGPDNAGTMTFNGTAGGRLFFGLSASSITITEIDTNA